MQALSRYDHAARRRIGAAFRLRGLRDHTYAQRAAQAEQAFLICCASAQDREQWREDSVLWTDDHVLLGQWSRNYLPLVVRSACPPRAPIHFVEKDVEWYRSHRDLPDPGFCKLHLYESWSKSVLDVSKDADVVVIGSYFPDAIATTHALLEAGYGPVLFYDIDTPVTLAELCSRGRTEYLDAALIPHYAAYLSFTGGPALRTLEEQFGSPRAVAFYCSVDAGLHKRTEVQDRYRCDLSYLGTYAADRQPKLMHYLNGAAGLLQDASFVVAGPQYPEATPWHKNVRRFDHVAPPQHPAFYSSSRFTLNLTRHDMVVAASRLPFGCLKRPHAEQPSSPTAGMD